MKVESRCPNKPRAVLLEHYENLMPSKLCYKKVWYAPEDLEKVLKEEQAATGAPAPETTTTTTETPTTVAPSPETTTTTTETPTTTAPSPP